LKGTPTCNPLKKEREGLTAGKKGKSCEKQTKTTKPKANSLISSLNNF